MFSAIIDKILIYALAVLLLITGGYAIYEHVKVDSLTTNLSIVTKDRDNYILKLQICNGVVVDQNKKITTASTDSQKLQKQLDDATTALNKQKQADDAIINNLKSQPAPKTCDAARDYLKDNVGKFQW